MAGINLKPKESKMDIKALLLIKEIADKNSWATLPKDEPRYKVFRIAEEAIKNPPKIEPVKKEKKPATKKTKGKKK